MKILMIGILCKNEALTLSCDADDYDALGRAQGPLCAKILGPLEKRNSETSGQSWAIASPVRESQLSRTLYRIVPSHASLRGIPKDRQSAPSVWLGEGAKVRTSCFHQ